MIYYALYKAKRQDQFNGKIYARTVHTETVDTEGLAEHMSKHNCSYSKGQILGLINDMATCIKEITLDGNAVKLPNLGIFKPSISCLPADSVKEFSVSSNVRRKRMICVPTGSMRLGKTGRTKTSGVEMKRVEKYDKDALEPEVNTGTEEGEP